MKGNSFVKIFSAAAVFLPLFSTLAKAQLPSPALSSTPALSSAPALSSTRDFVVVPAGDPLYQHLRTIRGAGWTGISNTASTLAGDSGALTHYELALETAKAVITVRARHHADAKWRRAASPDALRALRALCRALPHELARFDINADETLALLDEMLAPPSTRQSTLSTPQDVISRENPASRRLTADSPASLPLSQRLRVYSALSSLAAGARDPLAARSRETPNLFQLRSGQAAASNRTFAALDLNERLRLRAGFENEEPVAGSEISRHLRSDTASPGAISPGMISPGAMSSGAGERAVSGGAEFDLMPGVVLSGGVARVRNEFDRRGDGLRFGGGLGVSGWQNRLVVSAHLSRLVPEDSLALGTTAAQLNLGVEVTEQIQLKLLYQQMFGATDAARNTRLLGGLNINF